jgi:hypothetical protein
MSMTKRTGVAVACAAGVLAVAVVAWRPWRRTPLPSGRRPSRRRMRRRDCGQRSRRGAARRRASAKRAASRSAGTGTNRLVWVDGRWLHPEDSAIVTTALDAALDETTRTRSWPKRAAEAARRPRGSQPVAFALSWLGMRGLPDLTSMLTDPDRTLRRGAGPLEVVALRDRERAGQGALLGAAAEVLGSDMSDEMLFDLVMECSMLENEYALPQLVTLLGSVTKPSKSRR